MLHPTKKNISWKDTIPKTYEELIVILEANHFYPQKEVLVEKSGKKITGLRIEVAPILQESKKARLEEVLAPYPVKVSRINNQDYLLVEFKNKL